MTLTATDLKKTFDRKLLFHRLSMSLSAPVRCGVTGKNGSGKSTLLKLLAGVLSPTSGSLAYTVEIPSLEKPHRAASRIDIPHAQLYRYAGFVAPYLRLYDDLSGMENALFSLRAKGFSGSHLSALPALPALFEAFEMTAAKDKAYRTYSSGMQQRAKIIAAVCGAPAFLFLDEPTSTLDSSGKALFWNYIEKLPPQTLVIIASNDDDELQHCTQKLSVEHYK